jgi:hypothetical protein
MKGTAPAPSGGGVASPAGWRCAIGDDLSTSLPESHLPGFRPANFDTLYQ